MKTAIVKTSYWDEEEFTASHIDTKLVYNYLLTCPSRGISPFIKINKAVMAARTGLNTNNVALGLQQLEDLGWIVYHEGYIMFLKNHVEAKKGRFTEQALAKELAELPQEILNFFNRYRSGTLPEHIDIDIDKDNNIDINNNNLQLVMVDDQAVKLAEEMCSTITQNFPFVKCTTKNVGKWAADIDKIHRIDKYDWDIISGVMLWSLNHDFWKKNIRSGDKLRKQFETLLIQAKVEHETKKARVF